MNNERLTAIIEELHSGVPKENALVSFAQYGGGPDESNIVGTREGYQRLGIELLRMGTVDDIDSFNEKNKENQITLDYMVSENSDIQFDWFEVKENQSEIETDVDPRTWKDKLAITCACMFGLAWLLVLPALGLFFIVTLFTN